ncbi:MAG: mitochondrial fission ELM1 family protein [Gammaproteobacteria bacterium]|jgi:hypothetical protein
MNQPSQPDLQAGATVIASRPQPLVWVISGYRAGETTQLLALAEALGWPFEVKELRHRRWDFVPGLLRLSSLAGIEKAAREDLRAPWPDLVISAGMRNEPLARWIKDRAGGECRLVNVGRPWAGFDHFDLVITTPQYRLPERPNILQNIGTMHLFTDHALAAAARRWKPEFEHLPGPYIGVLIGGHSGPYTLGPAAARRLAVAAGRLAREMEGSLLATTSSRTSAAATEAFAGALDCPHYLFRWSPDSIQNPYQGILATADLLIVTSDTVSMISEAVGTGKPVFVFDLDGDDDFRLGALFYRLLMRVGHPRLTRDLELFHRRLTETGRAAWLGESLSKVRSEPLDDLARAVTRVKALVTSRDSRNA